MNMTRPSFAIDPAASGSGRLRVLSIISSAAPEYGGPIQGLISQHKELKDRVEFNVVSLDSPDAAFIATFPMPLAAMGLPPGEAAKRNPFSRHYNYPPNLIPWLRENIRHYDVILVHGLWSFATYAAARVLPGSGMPYFVFTHGMMDRYFRDAFPLKHAAKQAFWLFNEGPLLAGARTVLFTSEDEKLLARRVFAGYNRYKETVVGYGTNEPPVATPAQTDAFTAACPELGGRPYWLFLSRIDHKKGCDLLVDAFAAVAAREPGLQLVMAGPDKTGWTQTLKAQAEAQGVADRIHFTGGLFGDAKWGAIRGADAFVLPSHQENFGIVVAEAMACGTPVLTTYKVNIWREVEASGGGLAEDDTVPGITRLLNRWLDLSPEQRAAMRLGARAGYDAHFRMDAASASLHAVFMTQGMQADAAA